jgi:hypothetical protein
MVLSCEVVHEIEETNQRITSLRQSYFKLADVIVLKIKRIGDKLPERERLHQALDAYEHNMIPVETFIHRVSELLNIAML